MKAKIKKFTANDLFLQAAEKLKIQVSQVPGTDVSKLTHGGKSVHLKSSRTSALSAVGVHVCNSKKVTKHLLKTAGIPTPIWKEFYKGSTTEDIIEHSKQLRFPVVVKPNTGSHGDNIIMDVKTPEEVVPFVQALQSEFSVISVEEMFVGTEVRLLSTPKQLLAATVRRPASVLGDGKQTIEQLVREKNSDPNRIPRDNSASIQYLHLDEAELENLKELGYAPTSVPPEGERVYLQKVSNLAYGGDSIDVTDMLHPSINEIAPKIISALPEVPFGGIDFMTKDYTIEQTSETYVVIEINGNPMIDMHWLPYEGESRNPAFEIWKELFPSLNNN